MAGLIVIACCLALLGLALYTLACSPWTPNDPSEWREPDPRQSGVRLARGVIYGCGSSAVLILAVLAILWWAL